MSAQWKVNVGGRKIEYQYVPYPAYISISLDQTYEDKTGKVLMKYRQQDSWGQSKVEDGGRVRAYDPNNLWSPLLAVKGSSIQELEHAWLRRLERQLYLSLCAR